MADPSLQPLRRTAAPAAASTLARLLPFAGPLSLYLATMAPTIYNLDSAELTTAAATGGIVRATGYPLYLLLGRWWSRLPIGDPGYAMNLLSAVAGAATLAILDLVLRRLGVRGWARFGGLGLLAVSHFFWALSLIAEVYTLHTLMLGLIVWSLLRWSDRPRGDRLALAAFLTGLAFGNHAATVLLAPGCLWYVLRVGGPRALLPHSLLAALAGLAAGLAIYLYLPFLYLQEPAFNYAGSYDATGRFVPIDLTRPTELWWMASGGPFTSVMLAYTPRELVGEAGHFAGELVRAFFAIGVGPGALGLVVLWRRRRPLAELLVLWFVCSAGFYINYRVVDKDTMFLPVWAIWALWTALGYQWLLDWVARHPARPAMFARGRSLAALRGVVAAGVVASLLWTLPLVDLSRDTSTYLRGTAILGLVDHDALVVGWWDTVPVVEYLQLVEGRRPDVQAINRFLISPENLRPLVLRSLEERPVYLDQPAEDLFPELQAEPVGTLFRLWRRRSGRS